MVCFCVFILRWILEVPLSSSVSTHGLVEYQLSSKNFGTTVLHWFILLCGLAETQIFVLCMTKPCHRPLTPAIIALPQQKQWHVIGMGAWEGISNTEQLYLEKQVWKISYVLKPLTLRASWTQKESFAPTSLEKKKGYKKRISSKSLQDFFYHTWVGEHWQPGKVLF